MNTVDGHLLEILDRLAQRLHAPLWSPGRNRTMVLAHHSPVAFVWELYAVTGSRYVICVLGHEYLIACSNAAYDEVALALEHALSAGQTLVNGSEIKDLAEVAA